MAMPILTALGPAAGPASGGDLVRLHGVGFAARVQVLFGGVAATVLNVREEGGESFADVRTPAHPPGAVDATLRNLDAEGAPVPGEEASLASAYRFERAPIVREADLTRVVRALLRELKRQVIENVSASVALDYDDTPSDGLNVVAIARLPSLVLSGPRLVENRFFSTNEPNEDTVAGPSGPELQRRRPPFTVDLGFTITAASDRTVELLNLLAATATFLNRNRWLVLDRDPADPTLGAVRWEMDPDGEVRTRLDGEGEVRVFTAGLVVRGFDVDEGLPAEVGKAVAGEGPDLGIDVIGGAP
jgi:hypothetical protein